MPSQSDDLLEKGQSDPLQPEQRPPAVPNFLKQAMRVLHLLRPAFLSKPPATKVTLRRTAYLDGIRGFAALMVYIGHHQLWAHEAQNADKIFQSAWGFEGQYYLGCFPVVRNFFTGGHYAVVTFFVLSGYVLSTKPLALIQSGDLGAMADNVCANFFKRWLRLYLPIIGSTLTVVFLWHVFGVLANYVPQRTLSAELWTWYTEFKNFTFIFNTGSTIWFSYNPHTWSIPVEFKGSIVIYTSLMAFSRCTRNARLWCEAGLIYYFMWIADGAFFAMFMGGMMLCDLEMLAAKDELPSWISHLKRSDPAIWYVLFVVSLLLGGAPSHDLSMEALKASPGWRHLAFLKPQAVFDFKWFFLFWASMFLVASVPRIPLLKRFFESRFCRYLGRISYMFYLVHGPVMWTLGDRLYAAVGMSREGHAMGVPGWSNRFPIPKVGPFGLELSFLAAHLILLPFTLWVAEMATALIDDPSVKFCAWLYGRTIAPKSPQMRQGHFQPMGVK